jgi:hypothetical protein
MGYTNYWENKGDFDQRNWDDAVMEINEIFRRHRDIIQYEDDNDMKPLACRREIRFNGKGEDGHETFYVSPENGFGFCKTARKPYDIAVKEVLIALSHFCNFDVSSDGDEEDWNEAIKNLKKHHIEFNIGQLSS